MQTDYLLIGQGISGTWLSYYLQKEGKSFLVIDNNNKNAASRLAACIINPVTGRRHVEVWMAKEIIPFAWKAYTGLGKELGITAISQKDIIDFFPTPQMRLSFQQRVEEKGEYVSLGETKGNLAEYFNYEFGYGEIKPVYSAHLETILPAWRQRLKEKNLLLEEEFDIHQLHIKKEGIQYNGITAGKIIFCDGNSVNSNPYFQQLPFAPNKGEVIIAEIPALPNHHIYKKGMVLAPLATPDLWWIGSSYAWSFDDENPTAEFRNKTEQLLKGWLKTPFTIREHLCGIRPATLERRPFAGMHPQHPGIGILNGMGTKGCSLAPFFARQLVDNLVYNKPISPEVSVERFSKILSRNIS
ncbi:MAG: NAD(P)/FAD-dependent oxidoreductase [Bacteroidota bacterium]